MFIKSSVRGYHAYFVDASVTIGEVLACGGEHDNAHDKNAIAVKNEDQLLVGHVPRELSKITTAPHGNSIWILGFFFLPCLAQVEVGEKKIGLMVNSLTCA